MKAGILAKAGKLTFLSFFFHEKQQKTKQNKKQKQRPGSGLI